MDQDQSTLTFITESIPDFPVRQPKTVDIEASGGTPPYKFEITQGTLPKGLSFHERGRISGVAREVADVTINVKVTDRDGAHVTQTFQVITTAPQPGNAGW